MAIITSPFEKRRICYCFIVLEHGNVFVPVYADPFIGEQFMNI